MEPFDQRYDRGPRWDARVDAAQRWADHVLGIVAGETAAKVVPLALVG